MISIFDFNEYKAYFSAWIKTMPKAGHGQLKKMAEYLGINSVVMTQVLRGSKDFTVEQTAELATYLGLNDLETDYLLLLVQKERAGTHRLKSLIDKKLSETRERAGELKERLKVQEEMSDEAKSIFYTSWYYSAIRIISALPEFQTPEAISARLELPLVRVKRAIDFLLRYRLCVENESKTGITFGTQRTHIGSDSPLVPRHHANWRMRSINRTETATPKDLFYTGPMALSHEAAGKIRNELVKTIETATKAAIDSEKAERTACLNIDWFEF